MSGPLVVGYDGSPGADAALAHALTLAPRLDAELLLVFGSHATRAGGEARDLDEGLRERAEDVLSRGRATAEAAGARVRTQHAGGRGAEVLADVAAAEDAQMVLVGSTGERPLRGLLVGSTPYRLLHLARTPVLVVRVS